MLHRKWNLPGWIRDRTCIPCTGRQVLTPGPPGEPTQVLMTQDVCRHCHLPREGADWSQLRALLGASPPPSGGCSLFCPGSWLFSPRLCPADLPPQWHSWAKAVPGPSTGPGPGVPDQRVLPLHAWPSHPFPPCSSTCTWNCSGCSQHLTGSPPVLQTHLISMGTYGLTQNSFRFGNDGHHTDYCLLIHFFNMH